MKDTTKKKSKHTDLRIMAPRDSHAERERIEAMLQAAKLQDSLVIAAEETKEIAWPEVADTVSEMCQAWGAFHRYLDALGIENILIEQVPLNQRWMLDRWFSAIRVISEGIDELDGMVPDMEPYPDENRKEMVR
jgi:hypothetical protein